GEGGAVGGVRGRGGAGQRRRLRERRGRASRSPGRSRNHRGLHVDGGSRRAGVRAEGRVRRRVESHPGEAGGGFDEGGRLTKEARERDITVNRRAFHDYTIGERFEAGGPPLRSGGEGLRGNRARPTEGHAGSFRRSRVLVAR